MGKKYNYKKCRKIFYEALSSDQEITTQDRELTLKIEEGEEFKQCYSPDDAVRSQLPPFWFISNKGNVISVSKNKPYWLRKDENKNSGRYSYHFLIWKDDETSERKNIEAHNLVGLVFGCQKYGKAADLIEKDGLYAFGVKSDKLKVNGHHKSKNTDDNSPRNIEFISTEAHKIIDKTTNLNKFKNKDKALKFLREFGDMAKAEEPNKISLLVTGAKHDKSSNEFVEDSNYRELKTVDSIKLSNKAVKQIQIAQAIFVSRWIAEHCVETLVKEFGKEYFSEPKYLYTDICFYKVNVVDEDLVISEVNDTEELLNKDFIKCYLNKDKNAECLITE